MSCRASLRLMPGNVWPDVSTQQHLTRYDAVSPVRRDSQLHLAQIAAGASPELPAFAGLRPNLDQVARQHLPERMAIRRLSLVSLTKRFIDVARANITDFTQAFQSSDDEPGLTAKEREQLEAELKKSAGSRAGKQARHFVDAAEEAWEKAYRATQDKASEFQSQHGNAHTPSAAERRRNWYRTLEISEGASAAEVRKAYRKLVVKFHPDRFAEDSEKHAYATEVMRKVTEAYDGLREHLEG